MSYAGSIWHRARFVACALLAAVPAACRSTEVAEPPTQQPLTSFVSGGEIAARLGQPCADEGLTCVYGSCALGAVSGGRRCQDGIWIEEGIACPL